MEGFFENSNYKSGWKPLSKEYNVNTINTGLGSETFNVNIQNGKKELANKQQSNDKKTINKPSDSETYNANAENVADDAKLSEQNNIIEELSKISENIKALNDIIVSQNEKIDNLLSLYEKIETESKKSIFSRAWK